MNVELKPELERRLQTIAQERSQSLSDLVEEAMLSYLNALESESSSWVEATQALLPQVWPTETLRDGILLAEWESVRYGLDMPFRIPIGRASGLIGMRAIGENGHVDHSSRTRPVRARFGPRPPDAPEESRHAPQSAPRLPARAGPCLGHR